MIPMSLYTNLMATPSTVPVAVQPPVAEDGTATMTARLGDVQKKIQSLEGQLQTLESQHDCYLRDASDLTSRMNTIYDRVQPLSKKEDVAIKAAKISRYTGIGAGVLMTVGPMLAVQGARALGGAIFLVDVAILGASVLATEWSKRTRRDLTPQIEYLVDQWKSDKNQLDRLQAYHSGDTSRIGSLESQIKAERGNEQVLAMALSVNVTADPPRPEQSVRQEDEAIIIGNLRIPRRAMEN